MPQTVACLHSLLPLLNWKLKLRLAHTSNIFKEKKNGSNIYGFINEIHGPQISGNIHGPLILFSQNK